MSGFQPDVDIPIVFSGIRPGEKLFEELLHVNEGYNTTVHPKILVGRIAPVTPEAMDNAIRALRHAIEESPEVIRRTLADIVPEATLAGSSSRVHQEVAETLRALEAMDTLRTPSVVPGT
jgi:FlaA1/EpsC-like NDP-sugar epimerase